MFRFMKFQAGDGGETMTTCNLEQVSIVGDGELVLSTGGRITVTTYLNLNSLPADTIFSTTAGKTLTISGIEV